MKLLLSTRLGLRLAVVDEASFVHLFPSAYDAVLLSQELAKKGPMVLSSMSASFAWPTTLPWDPQVHRRPLGWSLVLDKV